MSGPSRISADRRRRDHHRAARARAAATASAWRSPRAGWPSTSTGPASTLFDYDVYALCSDGDMMEGISSEAASLAGHLKLGNLCWIYDNNHITIEGHTDLAFSDDVGARFEAYGWHVEHVDDANDIAIASTRPIAAFCSRTDASDDDHRRQPYRLRRAAQAGHRRRARRAAGRRRNPPGQAQLRLAGGCAVPRARRRARAFRRRHRQARRQASAGLGEADGRLSRRASRRKPKQLDQMLAGELPDRLGRRPAELRRRCQGHGQPRFVRQGAERLAPHFPWLRRRLGRSGALDQDAPHLRRGGRPRARHAAAAATCISASASTPWARS